MRTFFSVMLMLVFSQVYAQNSGCSRFFPFREGAVLEYAYFDKKDKQEATSRQVIESVEKTDAGVRATVQTELFDKKGELVSSGSFTVECKDDIFYMDMTNMIPESARQMIGSAQMEMKGDGFVLPNDLQVGQKFPDSYNEINLATGPINMKMTFEITDHMVESKETIQTEAGSFECFKVSYNMNSKVAIAKSTTRSVIYYADGVGTVRSESYDKKGNLEGVMILTNFR